MVTLAPLPIVDEFIRQYNVGQALLLLFILAVLGTIPLKSRRLVALNVLVFGFIFLATPSSMAPFHYRMLGIGLLVVGPLLYVTSER